jgi:hypothetical protein
MAQYVRPTLGQAIESGSVRVGKYTRVEAVTADWFATGSNAGASAIIKATSATGNINLIDGGTIPLAQISANHVFEVQPYSIDTVSGTVYVLYGHSR